MESRWPDGCRHQSPQARYGVLVVRCGAATELICFFYGQPHHIVQLKYNIKQFNLSFRPLSLLPFFNFKSILAFEKKRTLIVSASFFLFLMNIILGDISISSRDGLIMLLYTNFHPSIYINQRCEERPYKAFGYTITNIVCVWKWDWQGWSGVLSMYTEYSTINIGLR